MFLIQLTTMSHHLNQVTVTYMYMTSLVSLQTAVSGDKWLHDNGLISGSLCVGGALNRAHKIYCPMNSRNRSSRVLFDADDAVPVPSDSLDRVESDDTMESKKCPGKKSGDDVGFKPGDCVFVHSGKAVGSHIPCRIVQVVGKFYLLCSKKGVLGGRYTSEDLIASSCDFSIPLNDRVPLCHLISDPACLERCKCTLNKS